MCTKSLFIVLCLAVSRLEGSATTKQLKHFKHDKCPKDFDADPTPKDIVGTGLKTYTLYKVGMRDFPGGVVTWATESKSTFNYVQIDLNPEHFSKYKPGGEWHRDNKWEFVPVVKCGVETGWYGLRNRGRRGAYLTFARNGYVEKHRHYMVMDTAYPGDHDDGDFFVKPIIVMDGGQIYYQLVMKNKEHGAVIWSDKKYGSAGSRFIELDNNHQDKQHMTRYKPRGDLYQKTLFTMEDPEEETVEERKLPEFAIYF